MPRIAIRSMIPEDRPKLARIFRDAIHQGAAAWYDEAQRRAWAASLPAPEAWAERLSKGTVLVAAADGEPIGFMTLDGDGYVDLAFVAPSWAGRGVGRRLAAGIDRLARERALSRLHTQASLGARPMFEGCGWQIVREQTVERARVRLTNFVMEKQL